MIVINPEQYTPQLCCGRGGAGGGEVVECGEGARRRVRPPTNTNCHSFAEWVAVYRYTQPQPTHPPYTRRGPQLTQQSPPDPLSGVLGSKKQNSCFLVLIYFKTTCTFKFELQIDKEFIVARSGMHFRHFWIIDLGWPLPSNSTYRVHVGKFYEQLGMHSKTPPELIFV